MVPLAPALATPVAISIEPLDPEEPAFELEISTAPLAPVVLLPLETDRTPPVEAELAPADTRTAPPTPNDPAPAAITTDPLPAPDAAPVVIEIVPESPPAEEPDATLMLPLPRSLSAELSTIFPEFCDRLVPDAKVTSPPSSPWPAFI